MTTIIRMLWKKNAIDLDSKEIAEALGILKKNNLRVTDVASPLFKVDWPGAPKSKFSPKHDSFNSNLSYDQQDEVFDRCVELARKISTDRIRCFDFWRLENPAPYRKQINEVLQKAFRPLNTDRFIVRGGYGIYYNIQPWQFGSFPLRANPPFSGVRNFEAAAGATPSLFLDNPFPAGSGSTPSGISVEALPKSYRYPETHQWNFTLESQVRPDLAVRATYIGSEQEHATYLDPINTPLQAPGPVQPRRPVTAFGDIQVINNGSTSNTQMLQLAVTRRFASGLSFEAQYAWTKQLNSFPNGGRFSEPTDPQNIRYDRGNDPRIRQQYFIANYLYDLPFGKGRRFLGNLSRPMQLLVGGWETTGIVTLGSGLPFSVTFDSPLEGWYSSRADLVGNPSVSNRSRSEWFNTAAFQLPAPYTYGTSGSTFLFGPGFTNWDTAFMKNVAIGDKYNVQFRVEMFNTLNHPSFGNPASDISSPSAGTITRTASAARVVQLAGRFTF